jgi:Tol biopolymer transport system component/DNA-binding winged helix-turn-helix (wHTH) protein
MPSENGIGDPPGNSGSQYDPPMSDVIQPDRVRFGPYEVDLHTHEVWKFGTRVRLVGQPFAILAVLIARAGSLVTRDELREKLWPGETFVDFNHGLNAAVNKLRDVLCDSAEDPKYIETLPRRGYRFIAEVEWVTSSEVTPSTAVPMPAVLAETPIVELEPQKEDKRPHRLRWLMWTAGGLAAGILLFAIFISVLKISSAWAERIRNGEVLVTGPLKGVQVVLETGGRNEGPAYAPGGKRMVFMSNRGGAMDLWVSDANGTNPRQITTLGTTGTPRWSPDGKHIAFDARINDTGAILVTSADGGQPQIIVIGEGDNAVPSWSHDGKHIYYASERNGQYEVWRVGADGSGTLQITGQGGFAPLESPDGKTIYYAKTQFDRPEIWSVPAQGGEEKLVSRAIRTGTWGSWVLTANGIYFVEEGPGNVAALSHFDLRTQQLRQLTLLGRFPFWLAVSPDEKTALFDRADSETTTSLVELRDFQ